MTRALNSARVSPRVPPAWPSTLFAPRPGRPTSAWRGLYYYNVFRLLIALLLLGVFTLLGPSLTFGSRDALLFLYGSLGYVLSTLLALPFVGWRWPRFDVQLSLQLLGDVLFIVLLANASGGIESGLGLLLLASLAVAGLISRGRMTLFYAALATIGVLLLEVYEVFGQAAPSSKFIEASLLSVAYFATAWLAHQFAGYTAGAEELAAQRGVDLANMAQVNQLVIQDMQDGVLVVDEKGRIRQLNGHAEKLLGKKMPRALGGLLLSEYAPELAQALARWRQKAGPEILEGNTISARFVPIGRERSGGAVIFLEDLQRVQARAQALKLAALGRLTTSIAHEIRNPLSAISHATDLLLEDYEPDEVQSRLLRIISDNTQRLTRMVQDVLKLGRWSGGQLEAISLNDFLSKFVNEFCEIERVPANIFDIQVAGEVAVLFDRSHLNQVLWNLARNAVRYCRKQPSSICLSAERVPGDNIVKLEMIDDGPGVAPALRGQLFEPFFTTVSTGTGLGLCIAKEVCGANGAALDYVPTEAGARFRVICKEAN